MSRIFFVAMRSRKKGSHLFPYPFHQRSRRSTKRSDVKLVVVCTHADSHFEYAKARWKPGKMCWSKNRSPRRLPGEGAVCVGEKQRADRHAVSDRRFDSCFLTAKKAIESGKLERLLKWKAILTITARSQKPNWVAAGWRVLWPWCAYDGPDFSLFGRPDHVAYDIRSLRNKPILTILSKRNCFMAI